MRVVLVDDNELFLEGLRNMLEAVEIRVVAAITDPRRISAVVCRLTPDVVLMDIEMPGGNGIDAVRALKEDYPQARVVMMTVSDSDDNLFAAIVAGASGYLLKNTPPEQFMDALNGVTRGETPLSPGLAARILAEFSRRSLPREPIQRESVAELTPRQAEVLALAAEGRSYQQIAELLGLSVSAIKYHMGEITDRLQVENRAQAIAWAGSLRPK